MGTLDRGAAPSFTERVRQELAHVEVDRDCDRRAELAALVQLGGSLHIRGGQEVGDALRLHLTTPAGAVARRAYALLQQVHHVRAELHVEEPSGVRRSTRYVLVVDEGARRVAAAVGILDDGGRLQHADLDTFAREACDRTAYVRGALLAAGTCSGPGRPPHLELRVADRDTANGLARLVTVVAQHTAGVSTTARGWRVVVKSGRAIARLLGALGATDAYLRYEERLLRRELRNDATRLANADAANVRRAIEAASGQVREITWAADVLGWDSMDEEVRQVALARLANPSASLAEIGELVDPPIGKSTVHRRLKRLVAAAQEAVSGGDGPSGR